MRPSDLSLIRSIGRPAPIPDGPVLVSIVSPDVEHDRDQGRICRIDPAGSTAPIGADGDRADPGGPDRPDPVPFTLGQRDTAPVLSPDGRTLVFLRGTVDHPDQLFVMPVAGGEPRALTSTEQHPGGVPGPVAFTPDGRQLVYTARVPEPGRYGTDPEITSAAERPRRIRDRAYRVDGQGFVLDRPQQVFVLDLDPGGDPLATDPVPLRTPLRVTDEPRGATDPAVAADGSILYVRRAGPGALDDEIMSVAVPAAATDPPGTPRLLLRPGGTALRLTVTGDRLLFLGVRFGGIDYAGRTTGLFSYPLGERPPAAGADPSAAERLTAERLTDERLTDEHSVDIDVTAGPPVVLGPTGTTGGSGGPAGPARVLVAVQDRGSVALVAVPLDARAATLTDLARWTGPREVVRSFAVADDRLVAVVATAGSAGEVVQFDAGGPTPGRRLTDVAAPLRQSGLRPVETLTGTAPDGYPVHGFLVRPTGDGPHPVLLDVHGGPHAAYTDSFFDEAQVYAAAGYSVVLPNPRGSSGYGQEHGRGAVRHLGAVDVDDVLALLDAALRRPDSDAARVGVMGGSYGGFMTTWLAGHHPGRFVAAISERALNAWDSFAGSSDIGYFFAENYVGATREEQWAASPLAAADAIDIPMLIIHSEQDWRCPLEQGQRLFVALANRGAPVEMLIFPGEGHELSRAGRPRHRRDRFDAVLDWWDRHLPVTPATSAVPAG